MEKVASQMVMANRVLSKGVTRTQQLHVGEHHHGEGLVDLVVVAVRRGDARAGEGQGHRLGGRGGEVNGSLRVRGKGGCRGGVGSGET